jgi:hypothetical protein
VLDVDYCRLVNLGELNRKEVALLVLEIEIVGIVTATVNVTEKSFMQKIYRKLRQKRTGFQPNLREFCSFLHIFIYIYTIRQPILRFFSFLLYYNVAKAFQERKL